MRLLSIIPKISWIFIIILFTYSCKNDILLGDEEHEPRLIMNAYINANSTNNSLYLNLSGRSSISEINKAIVEIYVDDQLVEIAEEKDLKNYKKSQKHYLITTKFNPGDKVRIEARTENGKYHAWIEETVLHPPLPIEKVDTASVMIRIYDTFYNRLRFRITFTDKSDEINYYRLILERTMTIKARLENGNDTIATTKNCRMICNDDIALSDGHPNVGENLISDTPNNIYGVFNNNYFSGQTYTLNVYMEPNYYPYLSEPYEVLDLQQDCVIRIQSINQKNYKYLNTLNAIDSDVYDPIFMEPIRFISNVHNGLGFVNITSEFTQHIKLPKQNLYLY